MFWYSREQGVAIRISLFLLYHYKVRSYLTSSSDMVHRPMRLPDGRNFYGRAVEQQDQTVKVYFKFGMFGRTSTRMHFLSSLLVKIDDRPAGDLSPSSDFNLEESTLA